MPAAWSASPSPRRALAIRILRPSSRALRGRSAEPVADERGAALPRWYRGCFHVNLPDVPDGYAVLTAADGRLSLETVSHGLRIPE